MSDVACSCKEWAVLQKCQTLLADFRSGIATDHPLPQAAVVGSISVADRVKHTR